MANKRSTYRPGHAGYDAKSRRWRNAGGAVVPRPGKLRAAPLVEDVALGGFAAAMPLAPMSASFEQIENKLRGAANALEDIIKYDPVQMKPVDKRGKPVPAPNSVPSDILMSYRLIEYYLRTEGDVNQHVEAPIDMITGSELLVMGRDGGSKRELREIMDEIDLRHVLEQAWYSVAQYGIAYPLEVPNSDGEIAAVLHLPPRFMWVGYQVASTSVPPEGTYQVMPFNGEERWSEEMLKQSFMPMTYNAFSSQANEQIARGWGVWINPARLYPIRGRSMDWQRYPIPPLSRATRAISMRIVFDEYVRATIEGYKNQLWLWKVNWIKDKPPSPKKVAWLKAQVDGLAGKRTGSMVATGDVTVEVISPKPIDNMLAAETRVNFTLEIFRHLGTAVRLVTGNTVAPGRPDGTTLQVDLSVWLRRLESAEARVMIGWLPGFLARVAESRNDAKLAEMIRSGEIKVEFAASLLEKADQIEKELKPLYTMGLLSPQTTLTGAGHNYDVEIANKQEAQPHRELLSPPATFNQMTVSPDGSPAQQPSTTPGRPKESDAKLEDAFNDMAAVENLLTATAWEEDQVRAEYFQAVIDLSDHLFSGRIDPSSFVRDLGRLNEELLPGVSVASYRTYASVGEMPASLASYPAQFVNAFLPGLAEALSGEYDQDKMLARIALYPKTGYLMAYYNGQIQAMKQRGARSWRRVVSEGERRCPVCMADSSVAHPVDEPFTLMHPNENCGQSDLYLRYYVSGNVPSLSVPVRSITSEWDRAVESAQKIQRRSRA